MDSVTDKAFGYYPDMDKEIGFYVVCSDRMILDNINSIMKHKGYVGIADTAGRFHYMVDSRFGVHSAVRHITSEIAKRMDVTSLSNTSLLDAVKTVTEKYDLDCGLLGTRMIRFILLNSLRDPSLMTTVSKRIYPQTGQEYGVSGAQVERNIRYALRDTILFAQGHRNVYILQKFHEEASAELVRQFDCKPHETAL